MESPELRTYSFKKYRTRIFKRLDIIFLKRIKTLLIDQFSVKNRNVFGGYLNAYHLFVTSLKKVNDIWLIILIPVICTRCVIMSSNTNRCSPRCVSERQNCENVIEAIIVFCVFITISIFGCQSKNGTLIIGQH